MIYNESKYNREWEIKKLSQLGTFARGKSKHRPRNDKRLFEGGGYPLVQTGEIKDANLYITNHSQEYGEFGLKQSKMWDAETLCITIAANIAETALLSYPMCFPDSVVGFRANKDVSSEKFMYYVFDYIKHFIQNSASGSAQDNINIEYLTTLDFKIPPKKMQDKIVETLFCIDKKILLNNKINDGFAQYFSGKSFLAPVSTDQIGIFNVTFEPGCRNNWHIHHADKGGGQILVCVAGRGYYQEEGKEAVEMKPGDCINIPAGVKHWHGAAPDSWFSHLAIEVPGENVSNEWLESVSGADYEKLK